MSEAKEAIVLCEGYHDRAFWSGWLGRLGCTNQKTDPFGKSVAGGQYGFTTKMGGFVRVVPGQGDDKVLDLIAPTLRGRTTRPIDWLVVNVDSDAAHDDGSDARARRQQSIVGRFGVQDQVKETGPGRYVIEDGTNLGVVLWETTDPAHPELPSRQTLERLVCAALREVYPARSEAVEAWLRTRPDPEAEGCPTLGEKAFAWSHMAGWSSDSHCVWFYERLWQKPAVANALEARLRQSGAWDLVAALCG